METSAFLIVSIYKEGLDKYVETIEDYISYTVELKHVDDIREVNFKTNY